MDPIAFSAAAYYFDSHMRTGSDESRAGAAHKRFCGHDGPATTQNRLLQYLQTATPDSGYRAPHSCLPPSCRPPAMHEGCGTGPDRTPWYPGQSPGNPHDHSPARPPGCLPPGRPPFDCGPVTGRPVPVTVHTGSGDDRVNVHQNRDGSMSVTVNGDTTDYSAAQAKNFQLYTGGGNDVVTITGKAPRDGQGITVHAGSGNDTVIGGCGDDTVYGGSGNDFINTRGGDDKVYGGTGNDIIMSGDGQDRVYGGNGHDYIRSGRGDDVVSGGRGNDVIHSGRGDDFVTGGSGHDRIRTGSGNDRAYGGRGNDSLNLGRGNDYGFGGAGHDRVNGGAGHDTLHGGAGFDHLNGGPGIDRLLDQSESWLRLADTA